MSRLPGSAPIQIGAKNDLLTGILGAACVAALIALVVVVVRSYTIFEGGLFK